MSATSAAIAVTFALSGAGVLADYFLKLASGTPSPYSSRYLFIGMLTYAAPAVGWVYAMRHLKLAYIGVFYSISTVLMLCVIGWLFFDERLRPTEVAGVALAIVSLLLLSRVA